MRMVARRRSVRAGSGQALLETVVVMPVLVFLILGAVQLVLIAHARVMAHYAAFCAARAGIVHNGDWNVMRNAALIGALPVYLRTDDLEHFLASWAKVKAVAEITSEIDTGVASLERAIEGLWPENATGIGGVTIDPQIEGLVPDLSLIDVNVTSPTKQAFERNKDWQTGRASLALSHDPGGKLVYPLEAREIDFDDLELLENNPEAGRLAVQVRLLVPLRIPFVSRVLFELWLAQELLQVEYVRSDYQEWLRGSARAEGGKAHGGELSFEVAEADLPQHPSLSGELYTAKTQWTEEVGALRYIAEETGLYLLPIKASYAMQMQSNPYQSNRRAPVWFEAQMPPEEK